MNEENNQSFIDGQNIYMNTKANGWSIDLRRFRRYLLEKYKVQKAYYFLGSMKDENRDLYLQIQDAGFILVFREHNDSMIGKKKGNVDTDIVYMILTKLLDKEDFDNVILVSGDGDYYRTVKYLIDHKRFKKLLAPNRHSTSSLYGKLSPKYIDYLDKKEIKAKISIKKAGSS